MNLIKIENIQTGRTFVPGYWEKLRKTPSGFKSKAKYEKTIKNSGKKSENALLKRRYQKTYI